MTHYLFRVQDRFGFYQWEVKAHTTDEAFIIAARQCGAGCSLELTDQFTEPQ